MNLVFNKIKFSSSLLLLFVLGACGQNNGKELNDKENSQSLHHKYYSHTDKTKLNLNDTEWKKFFQKICI